MNLKSLAPVMVILGTAVFAQQTAPANPATGVPADAPSGAQRPMVMRAWGRNAKGNRQAALVTPPSLKERIQDLQGTVDKMHILLKQLHTRAAAIGKDPTVKASVEMWNLMVGQLEQQLQDLKQAEASREDMEARRAAMHEQAQIKAQAAAIAAQQALFSQPTSTAHTPAAGQAVTIPTPTNTQTAPSSSPIR